jgi:poly(3-hydroxybutyrate) depolymerase
MVSARTVVSFSRAVAFALVGVLAHAGAARAENIAVDGSRTGPRTLNHFVHFPSNYDPNERDTFPLLIMLHGVGERGDADAGSGLDLGVLSRVKKNGSPASLIDHGQWKDARGKEYPFIVVSPQAEPGARAWSVDALEDLLDYAISQYRADPQRVYFTGLSMGAYGTWAAAKKFGHRIAAIAPLSGGNSAIPDCGRVRHLGAWMFHGDQDTVVSYGKAVTSLKRFQGCRPAHPAKLTTFQGGKHSSVVWKNVYNNAFSQLDNVPAGDRAHRGADGKMYSDLYRWMLTFATNGAKPPAEKPTGEKPKPAPAPAEKDPPKKRKPKPVFMKNPYPNPHPIDGMNPWIDREKPTPRKPVRKFFNFWGHSVPKFFRGLFGRRD